MGALIIDAEVVAGGKEVYKLGKDGVQAAGRARDELAWRATAEQKDWSNGRVSVGGLHVDRIARYFYCIIGQRLKCETARGHPLHRSKGNQRHCGHAGRRGVGGSGRPIGGGGRGAIGQRQGIGQYALRHERRRRGGRHCRLRLR